MENYTGSCACQSVRYTFTGAPINSVFCYCHTCQEHSVSDKWFGLWVRKNNFKFTEGNTTCYTRQGDSGQSVKHFFCNHYGTTVCIYVAVGSFYSIPATTVKTAVNWKPTMGIYASHAPSWSVFPEDIPMYDVLPPELSQSH